MLSFLLWIIRLLPLGSWAPAVLPALNGAAEAIGALFEVIGRLIKALFDGVELVVTNPKTLYVVAAAFFGGMAYQYTHAAPKPAPSTAQKACICGTKKLTDSAPKSI